MKQILQSLKTGTTEVTDVPCPAVGRGKLLIGTSTTLETPCRQRRLLDGYLCRHCEEA